MKLKMTHSGKTAGHKPDKCIYIDYSKLDYVYTGVYTLSRGHGMQKVKVFTSGNSQAVRIPKEFSVDESELFIQRVGNSLILTPTHDPLNSLKDSLEKFSKDIFSEGREQPEMEKREEL